MTMPATQRDVHASARAAPAHDPIPPVRTRPHLYLVGEAERSNRAPTAPAGRVSIQINGCWHALRGRTATFTQLLGLAFPDRRRGAVCRGLTWLACADRTGLQFRPCPQHSNPGEHP